LPRIMEELEFEFHFITITVDSVQCMRSRFVLDNQCWLSVCDCLERAHIIKWNRNRAIRW
jgi:hypothetical protein